MLHKEIVYRAIQIMFFTQTHQMLTPILQQFSTNLNEISLPTQMKKRPQPKKINLFSHLQINTLYLQTKTKMMKPKIPMKFSLISTRTPKPNKKSNLLYPSL
jgi:hypothetical protein